MASIFRKRRRKTSGQVAKDRLKFIVYHDRVNVAYPLLAEMKEEIIQVITKFVEVDKESLEINFQVEGGREVLAVTIPISHERIRR